jgi:hypothetical protein
MTNENKADLLGFAKARAKKLRAYLTEQNHKISHSFSLEAIAKTEGFRDWNTYAAHFKIAEGAHSHAPKKDFAGRYPLQVGDRVEGRFRDTPFKGTLIGLEQTINPGVWRAKLHFDEAVMPEDAKRIGHTRQRVRCMLDASGQSVNLKGKADGTISLQL